VTGRRFGEDGSATVVVLALAAVLGCAGLLVLVLAQVALCRERAEAAADLAALAGAAHVLDGHACAAAATVARAQGARLLACRIDGWQVRVVAGVGLGGALHDLGQARARARAGPPLSPAAS